MPSRTRIENVKCNILTPTLQSAVDELASTYRKTKQVTSQQCGVIAEKIAKAAVAYEQLCEDFEESRERAEAAEVSLREATKALELLQGDLSAQARSMIESQEAYEELREKVSERKRPRELSGC